MRRAIALLPFVLVVAAAGCGGDDDDSEPLTKAEYIEQADAICQAYRAVSDPLVEEALAQFDSSDFEAAAGTLAEAIQAAEPGIEELERLPKPTGDEAVLEQVDALRQQSLALFERLEDAKRSVTRTRSIIREADAVDERTDAIQTGYGFKVCGQGEE